MVFCHVLSHKLLPLFLPFVKNLLLLKALFCLRVVTQTSANFASAIAEGSAGKVCSATCSISDFY
jgi:hypothetical protein